VSSLQAQRAHQTVLNFTPVGSTVPFLVSNKFVSLIVGPYGSTKTTTGVMKIAYEASRVAACSDGIRRSRYAVVRNTRQQLFDTTIPDFMKWFPDGEAGFFTKHDAKFVLKFADVECEVLFRGLDDANDVRRLLSLQLTGAMMDEFREIHPEIYKALAGRTGRYPDKVLVPPRVQWGVDDKGNPIGGCVQDDGRAAKRLWGMSNPPDMDTFWEQVISGPPGNMHVSIQPGGMSPAADWVHLLDSGYYEGLMELHANNPEWVDVYVHAKFGASLAGRPVFGGFRQDFHVAKSPLVPIVSMEHPLIVGIDFGLTPACTISQNTPKGQYLTFAELFSDNMGIIRFCREKLKPTLSGRFPGHPVLVVGDPAGGQRSQVDERTVFDAMRTEGFRVIPARTQDVRARITAMERLLAGQIDGEARHLIDPECKRLITALRGGYRYRINTKGETEPSPDKNVYSHLMEGHCYGGMHVDGPDFGGMLTGTGRRAIIPGSTAGWV
jgi:hypothetical protein